LKAKTTLIYYICIVNALQIIATRTARKIAKSLISDCFLVHVFMANIKYNTIMNIFSKFFIFANLLALQRHLTHNLFAIETLAEIRILRPTYLHVVIESLDA